MELYIFYNEKDMTTSSLSVNYYTRANFLLDDLCEDSECDTIYTHLVLEHYNAEDVSDIILHWFKKLRRSGKLIINGLNIDAIANGFINKDLSLSDINALLYGDKPTPRKSILSPFDLRDALQEHGMLITKMRKKDFTYMIEAQKQ